MSRSPLYIVSRVILAAASLLVATSTFSFAQSPIQQRNACIGKDNSTAAAKLAACIAIIDAARESPSVMAQAFTVRGDAAREKNEFDQAIEDYNQAIQADSRFAVAYFNRGLSRAAKGEIDHAIADYDQAVQYDARNAAAWKARAAAYYGKHEYSRAINDLTQAWKLNPRRNCSF